jgi:hypothetical protein
LRGAQATRQSVFFDFILNQFASLRSQRQLKEFFSKLLKMGGVGQHVSQWGILAQNPDPSKILKTALWGTAVISKAISGQYLCQGDHPTTAY